MILILLITCFSAVSTENTFRNVTVQGYFFNTTVAVVLGYRYRESDIIYKPVFQEIVSDSNSLVDHLPNTTDYNIICIINQNIPALRANCLAGLNQENLEIRGCNLKEIEPGSFNNVTLLNKLDLARNRLKIIHRGVFNGLNASTLSLEENEIETIESGAFLNTNFYNLSLTGNKLLVASNGVYSNLQIWCNYSRLCSRYVLDGDLSLGQNEITDLNEHAFSNCTIGKLLDLSRNKLEVLRKSAFVNISVKILYLAGNKIKLVEKGSFSGVRRLDEVYLDYNDLENITGIFENAPVRRIFIEHNKISELLPGTFDKIPNLNELHLYNNSIQEIKRGVFNGSTIKRLFLTQNQIRHIEGGAFNNMPNLEDAALDRNMLEKVTTGTFAHNPVSQIRLAHNGIKDLEPRSFEYLTAESIRIRLDHNQLVEIKKNVFKNLPGVALSIQYNRIRTIESGAFDSISEIHLLDLTGNCLTTIETNIFSNMKIHNLELDRNEIETIKSNAFSNLEGVSLIDLSNNKLKRINESIFNNVLSVQILILRGNEIADTKENLLKQFPNVKELIVTGDYSRWFEYI